MLGGTVVNITGPCFNESQKIKCRFENEIVMGTVIDKNRAICVQPFLKYEGYIRFYIAIDSGTYDWKGKYFVGKISLLLRDHFYLIRGKNDFAEIFKNLSRYTSENNFFRSKIIRGDLSMMSNAAKSFDKKFF